MVGLELQEELKMPEEVLKFTKTVMLIQCVVGASFGLVFVLAGEWFMEFEQWPYHAPVFIRLTGLDFIGMGLLVFLSSRETEYARVKNVVIMVIFWTVLNSIVFTILHFVHDLPLINWTNIGSYMMFATLYIMIYIKQKK